MHLAHDALVVVLIASLGVAILEPVNLGGPSDVISHASAGLVASLERAPCEGLRVLYRL